MIYIYRIIVILRQIEHRQQYIQRLVGVKKMCEYIIQIKMCSMFCYSAHISICFIAYIFHYFIPPWVWQETLQDCHHAHCPLPLSIVIRMTIRQLNLPACLENPKWLTRIFSEMNRSIIPCYSYKRSQLQQHIYYCYIFHHTTDIHPEPPRATHSHFQWHCVVV